MSLALVKIALAAFYFAFSFSALSAANMIRADDQMIRIIFQEAKKDKWDDAHRKQITKLALKKAKDMAASNPDIAKDIMFEEGGEEAERKVDISLISLDDNNILLTLSTCLHAYQTSGCLFLINKNKADWTLLNFLAFDGDKMIPLYSCIIDNISYDTPELSLNTRGAGYYAGVKTSVSYVFRDGAFQYIRCHDSRLDEKKLEGVNTRGEDFDYGEYMKGKVVSWNKDIGNLFQKFTSKDSNDLKNNKNWQNIYFVKISKAYFHEQPDDKAKQASYLISGDAVYVSEKKGNWVFANYLDSKTQKTSSGWIRLEDVTYLWEDYL
jgi:hypothetical protein